MLCQFSSKRRQQQRVRHSQATTVPSLQNSTFERHAAAVYNKKQQCEESRTRMFTVSDLSPSTLHTHIYTSIHKYFSLCSEREKKSSSAYRRLREIETLLSRPVHYVHFNDWLVSAPLRLFVVFGMRINIEKAARLR